jgi:hypothetical protein
MSIANSAISPIFNQVDHSLYICRRNQQAAMDKEHCGLISVIHNSAILYIALSNPKGRIVRMHPMHPPIFEYHPGQNPQPFE